MIHHEAPMRFPIFIHTLIISRNLFDHKLLTLRPQAAFTKSQWSKVCQKCTFPSLEHVTSKMMLNSAKCTQLWRFAFSKSVLGMKNMKLQWPWIPKMFSASFQHLKTRTRISWHHFFQNFVNHFFENDFFLEYSKNKRFSAEITSTRDLLKNKPKNAWTKKSHRSYLQIWFTTRRLCDFESSFIH